MNTRIYNVINIFQLVIIYYYTLIIITILITFNIIRYTYIFIFIFYVFVYNFIFPLIALEQFVINMINSTNIILWLIKTNKIKKII